MKNIENNYQHEQVDKQSNSDTKGKIANLRNQINWSRDNTKEAVKKTLSQDTNQRLEEVFWLNAEVSQVDIELAAMFWEDVYNNMLNLAAKQEQEPKSFASVISEADEELLAA